MVTGLSLSLCVSGICRGDTRKLRIKKLITATDAPDLKSYLQVIRSYQESYWYDYKIRAAFVALWFWFTGRIDQPRTRGEDIYFVGDGSWMDEEQNTFRVGKDGVRKYSGQKLTIWN